MHYIQVGIEGRLGYSNSWCTICWIVEGELVTYFWIGIHSYTFSSFALQFRFLGFPFPFFFLIFLISSSKLNNASSSIRLTNLAKPYHVHYHLSQPDMAGSVDTSAAASVQCFMLLADVRGNKACSKQRMYG